MKSLLIILGFIMLSCRHNTAPEMVIYSHAVKDSFELYIDTPPGINSNQPYDVVYYCDANLRSGKKLRALIQKSAYAEKVHHTIFVGIGHTGPYRMLRRRDFTVPRIEGGDTLGRSANNGQIENFYQFMKTELIPMINAAYNTNPDNNSILGHSLSGLFVFYCLFKNDTLFRNYYALSPSLWINNYSIYRFNQLTEGSMPSRNLYFSAGGLEILNRIKSGANKMAVFLKEKGYENLHYKYEVHAWETHHSQVEKSLDYMLRQNR